MHKLLTFTRRISEAKRYKDLYYIVFVAELGFSSVEELATDLLSLKIVPKWTKTASTNMKTIVENLATWAPRIKDNDPSGLLTEAGIADAFRRLTAAYKPVV